ncbi:MAG: DUF1573 domain-containing protein [Deltaproteobacteria bacterium]|nr:DUF1573 domain-containing protein [Deltaproteobacteria bacterium]
MVRCRAVVLFSFLAFMLGAFGGKSWGEQGPRMILPESVYDAGEVKEGAVVSHTFKVLNRGDRDLKIEDVRVDCGCSTVEFDRSIPPGREGKITLKVDTKGYEGKIRKGAVIRANDPSRRPSTIHIEVRVVVPIRMSGGHVLFKGPAGQELTKSIEIRAQMETPLKLEVTHFDLQGKVLYRLQEVETGKTFLLHVTSLPAPPGHYHGTLKLKTSYPEKPEIVIPIRARFSKAQ